ncbi:MAG TPA: RluA family pseudouridine synthase [Oscillatoriales cyanobacterium M4454_W2019_049]|nr:MAG: RluA family pseudouridine synthase [Cyanobacteria bacterium J055]HIK30287.1 RluA family pseudouridine synthase [Oscillatoriales cyanobacterium M4454_W2019_049]
MNSGWTYREKIDRADVGLTVLDYYTQRYRHSSETQWRDRIVAGQILLDGIPTHPEARLKKGQELTYHRSPWVEPEAPLDFEVLYEDSDLLVVEKPSGLPVLPGGGYLEHTLLHQLKRHYPQDTPVPIHRLGRGTSGLVLLARSPLAKTHLTQQMFDRQIGKVYRALASGVSDKDEFTVDRAIGKIPHPVIGYIYGATPNGRFSRSDCRVLQRRGNSMLVEVTILTGRPHQIRIHLAAAGFPLVGDPLYEIGGIPKLPGDGDSLPVPGDCGYHLHAYTLSFRHPRTEEPMRVMSPPPIELQTRSNLS